MTQCEKCHLEFETDLIKCVQCGEPTTALIVGQAGDGPIRSTNRQTSDSDSSSGFLSFSGVLMGLVGLIVAFALFSNAKSGFGGLDNKMIIGGIIVLAYQGIISYLCFKVANLTDRIAKLKQ